MSQNISSPPGSSAQNLTELLIKSGERKFQLLQSRMAGLEPAKLMQVTPPFPEDKSVVREHHSRGDHGDITASTIEDNISSPHTGMGMTYGNPYDHHGTAMNVSMEEEEPRVALSQTKVNELIVIDSSSNGSPSRQGDSNRGLVGEKRPRSDDDSHGGFTSESIDRPKSPKYRHSEEGDNTPPQHDTGSRGANESKKQKDIKSYFTSASHYSSETTQLLPTTTTTSSNGSASTSNPSPAETAPSSRSSGTATSSKSSKSLAKLEKEATQAKENTLLDLKKQYDAMRVVKEQLEFKLQRTEVDLKLATDSITIAEDRNKKTMTALADVYRKMAVQEFRRKREKLALDSVRLGKISTIRNGPGSVIDVFEDGYAGKELNRRFSELIRRKEELEARKRKLNNLKKQVKKSAAAAASSSSSATTSILLESHHSDLIGLPSPAVNDADIELDLLTEAEIISCHTSQLKQDEAAFVEEKRLLEAEKAVHMKELKRCQCEERSKFYRELPLLHGRYLFQSMLGRGGFSEVWKAIDLMELKDVAVKIHQLNPDWKEERKASYIKHVTREYTIHRDMKHPRVVQLFDVFEIDQDSFGTVLEYCKGIDLDERLKRQRTIPEKDARAIFMQILSGLRYLYHPFTYNFGGLSDSNGGSNTASTNGENEEFRMNPRQHYYKKLSIIHYDLKPANILFDENGDLKITDFGLAKVINEAEDGTSMELTSQGAGTYWYLPPECFRQNGPNAPTVSQKVDVWSAGVIFYQMLYGIRPFGEGQSQESIWSQQTMLNARSVSFPPDTPKLKVTEEAKDLIRKCLQYDPKSRPDVIALCQDPYFSKSLK